MCSRSRVVVSVCSGGAGEAGDVNGCEVDATGRLRALSGARQYRLYERVGL